MEAILTTVHWSQISMYARCAVQYEFRYVKGLKRPPGIAAFKGRGTHAGIELNLAHKLANALEPAPRDSICDIARDTVVNDIRKDGVLLSDEENARGLKAVIGEAADGAVRLALLHYDELAPKIVPVSIERPWELEWESQSAILAGRIDIEVETGIRDTKTASRSPNEDAANKSDQLTMYAMAWQKEHDDQLPSFLALDHLVDAKTPKIVTLVTQRTEEDFEKMKARITAFLGAIRSGVFVPTDRSSWVCDPRWCGYFHECQYV